MGAALAVDALAVFRLTRLATRDTITEPLRARIPPDSKLAELLACPYCAGFWVACGVAAARRIAPRVWGPLAEALAFSAVTGLVATNLD